MLVGREGLRKVVMEIASKVPMSPQAIGAGFAGARGKKEMDMARGVLRQVWPRVTKVIVGQDTDSALGAAWGVEDGFLVIAGTGSNVVGRVKGRKYGAGGTGIFWEMRAVGMIWLNGRFGRYCVNGIVKEKLLLLRRL